jgi:hypothetical protein
MGSQTDKVSRLKRRIQSTEQTKKEIFRHTMKALAWWDKANSRIGHTANTLLRYSDRVYGGRLSFTEWMSISPFKVIRKLFKQGAADANERDDLHWQFDRWRVECILGGAETLNADQIATKLNMSVERVEEILKFMAEKTVPKRTVQ